MSKNNPSSHKNLYYVFDPLCGWCYGAGATVAALSANPAFTLRALPSGLFADSGGRRMDEAFASYAWSNDQRIERLTGQPFSERYRSGVLADFRQAFDSGPATLALTAVALTDPQAELQTLAVLQRARYVDGQDITRYDTLAALLQHSGLPQAAARLSAADTDAELLELRRARQTKAQALLQAHGARGVPAFILEHDGNRQLLRTDAVYTDPQGFIDSLIAA